MQPAVLPAEIFCLEKLYSCVTSKLSNAFGTPLNIHQSTYPTRAVGITLGLPQFKCHLFQKKKSGIENARFGALREEVARFFFLEKRWGSIGIYN